MTSVDRAVGRHYDTFLAPIYAWMVGDPEVAQSRAREEIDRIAPFAGGAVAVDLGAGLGYHARALADAGHETVWMMDTSAHLLAAAEGVVGDARAHAVEADLTAFDAHIGSSLVDTIVCMGDTLTHLADRDEVAVLLEKVAASLRPGGVFMATFRDYTRGLTGVDRFVPVRSDDQRILTVFLEYRDETVQVHDLLWERRDQGWSQRVSSYPKVRVDPNQVAMLLRDHGLSVEVEAGVGGLSRIIARR